MSQEEKEVIENDVSRDTKGNNGENESGKIEDISKDIETKLKKNAEKEKEKEPLKLEKEVIQDEEMAGEIMENKSNNFIFVSIAVIIAIFGAIVFYFFNLKNDDSVEETDENGELIQTIKESKSGLDGF